MPYGWGTRRSWLPAQLEASPLHWLVSLVLGGTLYAGRGEKESLASPCYKTQGSKAVTPSPAGLVPAYRRASVTFCSNFILLSWIWGSRLPFWIYMICVKQILICAPIPADSILLMVATLVQDQWQTEILSKLLSQWETAETRLLQLSDPQGFLSLLGWAELGGGCIHTLFFLGPGCWICKMGIQKAVCVHGS